MLIINIDMVDPAKPRLDILSLYDQEVKKLSIKK